MGMEYGHLGPRGFEFDPMPEFVIDASAQTLSEMSEYRAAFAIGGGGIGIGHALVPASGLIVAFAEDGESAGSDDPLVLGGYA
jgi:hypothetical protein